VTKICRIITDNKAGNMNPALALADEVVKQSPFEIKIEHIKVQNKTLFRLLPIKLIQLLKLHKFIYKQCKITHNPDVVLTIGNGSASIMPCVALSLDERLNHQEKGLFVQLQNPRINPQHFDYVVAPMHDDVRNSNVIPTIGSLSRVHNILATTNFKVPTEFLELPKPVIAVFIGGSNSRYTFSHKEATQLAQYLLGFSISNKVSLAITCSRRTGKENEQILRNLLNGDTIYFPEIAVDASQENPYYMMLKYCEASIVTCDSVNMISDSVVAGLQTFLYTLPGDNGKFAYFYNALKRRGLLSNTSDDYQKKRIGVLNETQRVAKIIIAALLKKESNHG
jgi:mitochondrial fission protein ELM1